MSPTSYQAAPPREFILHDLRPFRNETTRCVWQRRRVIRLQRGYAGKGRGAMRSPQVQILLDHGIRSMADPRLDDVARDALLNQVRHTPMTKGVHSALLQTELLEQRMKMTTQEGRVTVRLAAPVGEQQTYLAIANVLLDEFQ